MPTRELFKWGVRYLLWYVLLTVVLTVAGYFWRPIAEASLGFALTFSAAAFTVMGFVKSREAVPSRTEYWSLVATSTVISVIVDFAQLMLFISLAEQPRQLGFWGGVFVFVVAAGIGVLANAFGYSGVFSAPALRKLLKKKTKRAVVTRSTQ